MKQIKKGMVYCPDGSLEWVKNHALVPTPELINDKVIRIYTSSCDDNGIERVGFSEVDAYNPSKILRIYDTPILDVGRPSTFDDNGVLPCCILNYEDKKLLYYVGLQKGTKIEFYLSTGLAISQDDGYSFKRYSEVPVVERSHSEPFFRGGAFVMYDNSI